MRFSHFFIDRPIFAAVLSILLTIAGAIAQRSLPISEYPEIAPPTVNISATYPGASAEVIAATVATPIEQEVNGVDDMLYIVSQLTGDGRVSIDVVFKAGVNVDQAQVLVQNRVAIAEPRLPEDVRRLGVTVRKASPDLMMVVHLTSPDGSRNQQYISNYATLFIKDAVARVDGVGNVNIFGARDYSMRVWLDPAKVAARGQSPGGGGRHQSAAREFARRVPIVGANAGTSQRPRAVRRDRRPGRPGRLHPRARYRESGARRARLYGQRLPQPRHRHRARHIPKAGIERARHRCGREGTNGAGEEGLSFRPRLFHRLQPDRIHPAVGQ
jgi:AcrB/AcrD/AcrF family